MVTLSITEENYLKAIYTIFLENGGKVNNQSIAERLNINPASVTDMLRKLNEKQYIEYNRTDGAKLTEKGQVIATKTIRKHRLWETFLVMKLNFTWDEIHDVAEQLEHIHSDKLIDELDKYLGYPKFDPHGDPIPDASGNIMEIFSYPLSEATAGNKVKVINVSDNSPAFLRYLNKQGINLNSEMVVKEIQEFDKSILVELAPDKEVFLSPEACKNILIA